MEQPELTQQEAYSLIGSQIKLVPEAEIDKEGKPIIIISFDNFTPNATNPEFRDNFIIFDIYCPFDTWELGDFRLRPYKSAGRIDARLNNKKLTGIMKTGFSNLHMNSFSKCSFIL